MMKRNRWLASAGVVLIFSFLGVSAAGAFSGLSRKDLKSRVEALEKQNAELQKRIADLELKIDVLTQRLNAQCGPGDAGEFPQEAALSSRVPKVPRLEVVQLEPEKPDSSSPSSSPGPKGRLFVEKGDANNPVLIEHGAPLPGTSYVPLPDPALTMSPPPEKKTAPEPPAVTPAPAMAAPSSPPGGGPYETVAYEEIKGLMAEGQTLEAQPRMEEYLKRFPGGVHEAEVANWLGMVYFQQGHYQKAIATFKIVTNKHYESAVAPDALYNLGLAYLELGKTKEAAEALREVKILYPFSQAAKLAEKKLASCCQ